MARRSLAIRGASIGDLTPPVGEASALHGLASAAPVRSARVVPLWRDRTRTGDTTGDTTGVSCPNRSAPRLERRRRRRLFGDRISAEVRVAATRRPTPAARPERAPSVRLRRRLLSLESNTLALWVRADTASVVTTRDSRSSGRRKIRQVPVSGAYDSHKAGRLRSRSPHATCAPLRDKRQRRERSSGAHSLCAKAALGTRNKRPAV
jgi:hypothetical protein